MTASSAEDPTFAFERAKLVPSDGTQDDDFSNGLAIDGDTLVVGSPEAPGCDGCTSGGKAYLFARDGGAWNETSILTGSDVERGDDFGEAVAIQGDLVFVGAYNPSSGHLTNDGPDGDVATGKVYVFENGVEVAKLQPSDGKHGEEFGAALEVSGQTLFVAADKASYPGGGGASWAGRVYVFEQGPGGAADWTEVDQLSLPVAPRESFEEFGWTLAASGDTLFVTSTGSNVPGAVDFVVWVFERDGLGNWQLQQLLGSSDQEPNARFGEALAIDGDRAIIGAILADSAFPATGAAYIFERNANGDWLEVAKLQEDIENMTRYGFGVDIEGDVAVVGARGANFGRGAAFVYHRNLGGPDRWGRVAVLVASDGEDGDSLGRNVVIDGQTVVLSAEGDDDVCGPGGSQSCDAGAVYLFGEL